MPIDRCRTRFRMNEKKRDNVDPASLWGFLPPADADEPIIEPPPVQVQNENLRLDWCTGQGDFFR